jgi:ferritin-like metal-binding protein YciE
MGLFSKDIKTLDDLFVHTLQDIYYAENQIAKNLPTMAEKAQDPQLKSAFQQHLAETQNQIKRLEQVFQQHGQPVKGVKCAAMDGILEEATEIMGDCDDPDVRDAAMLSAAQAVEHYEITRYGALVAWATELGRTDCVPALKANLAEEKATDQKLTALAERRINPKAQEKAEQKPAKSQSKSTARRSKPKSRARPAAKAKRNGTKKARRRA